MASSGEAVPTSDAPRSIKALEQNVVNKIAAGEIIVAPVHALKELTENAVDAGSTSIDIVVKDGGLKLLQITDNGHGINRDDLPILCERFTTSKLESFEDLTTIGTYGFRGEALASISHIAHLQVTTRTKESSCAWRANYAEGKLVAPKPGQGAEPRATAGRQGTQITVEDLFYNVPTRRRAFRAASEEYAKILDMVGRYAIHCHGVGFSCKKHGDSSIGVAVPAAASTVARIQQVHGSAVSRELLELKASSTTWGFSCNGWISNANYSVKKLVLLLFINHRAVESSALRKAIEQTYAMFLPRGGHPWVYLSLDIDPQRVDVNVHPTKREVNFLNEDEIIENICDEIRVCLSNVDSSRTFMTQTLLPGARIPTISVDPSDARSPGASGTTSTASKPAPGQTPQRGAVRPNESNLVRTDARARKITSMFASAVPPTSGNEDVSVDENDEDTPMADAPQYEITDKESKICRLTSVMNLRTEVRELMHNGLTEAFASHTFVGVVDHQRRLAAIQSGVKLYLVDYGLASAEFFYQLGLTDFANFGTMKLDQPLRLRDLLEIAAEAERSRADTREAEDFDWDEAVATVEDHLVTKRDMLAEYFSLHISAKGDLIGLPLLVKGYTPSMTKLPQFLFRLGPYVDWDDEKGCFKSFLRELAAWYVPEALPNAPVPTIEEDTQHAEDDEPDLAALRAETTSALENTLFPAFKARLIATKGMLKGVVEVADLKGLYRVFERC